MKKWLLMLALFMLPVHGFGQTIQPARCQATLVISNTTPVLLSTATIGPNSGPACQWPNASQFDGYMWVLNESASAGNVYLCQAGDTPANPCSTSNGLERVPGAPWGFYRPSSLFKVVAASSATVQVQW